MKNSRLVTIMGQQSSGGSCIIMPISLADSSLAQISGNRCYSNMVNGSVHKIDEGVEPDIYDIMVLKEELCCICKKETKA